jgi:hypothetical protein
MHSSFYSFFNFFLIFILVHLYSLDIYIFFFGNLDELSGTNILNVSRLNSVFTYFSPINTEKMYYIQICTDT